MQARRNAGKMIFSTSKTVVFNLINERYGFIYDTFKNTEIDFAFNRQQQKPCNYPASSEINMH